jgi:hypothetical protein
MVLDFSSWLRKFLAGLQLDDAEGAYDFVRSRIEIQNDVTKSVSGGHPKTIRSVREDVSSHRRKATPGDYKEKLTPETISKLNLRFGEVLDVLGYSRSQYETSKIPHTFP